MARMITDEIIDAINLMIGECNHPNQITGMIKLKNMLSDFDEDGWFKKV